MGHRPPVAISRSLVEPLESRQLLSGTVAPASHFTLTPIPITAEVNDTFSGQVARISNFNGKATDLRVVIHWGDGSKESLGTVQSDDNGGFSVFGEHKYTKAGHNNAIIAVAHHGGVRTTADVFTDKDGGTSLVEKTGKSFTAPLGTFDFSNVDFALNATITWGDGTTSAGTVERTALDDYRVIGTHTYAKAGTFKATVSVTSQLAGNPNSQPHPVTQFVTTIVVKGHA